MNTATGTADIRFLRLVLVSLILCTLASAGICVKLASAGTGAEETRIAARF